MRKTIVWDVDDVLNDLMWAWLSSYNNRFNTNYAYDDIRRNPPHELLGISKEEYLADLDWFRATNYQYLDPDPHVYHWFMENGHNANHVALTSTPRRSAPISAQWVMNHFGNWIRTFSFVPSHRASDGDEVLDYHVSKGAYTQDVLRDAVAFVDDKPENFIHVWNGGQVYSVWTPWNRSGLKIVDILNSLTSIKGIV